MEQQNNEQRNFSFWKLLSFLFLILLLGTGSLWFLTLTNLRDKQAELSNLENERLKNEQFSVALQLENDHYQLIQDFLTDPNLTYVALNDSQNPAKNPIYLIWNKPKKTAVLWTKRQVPQKKGTQFQLWIESEGGILSAGLFYADEFGRVTEPFPISKTSCSRFFMTEEKLGGAGKPTISALIFSSNPL